MPLRYCIFQLLSARLDIRPFLPSFSDRLASIASTQANMNRSAVQAIAYSCRAEQKKNQIKNEFHFPHRSRRTLT